MLHEVHDVLALKAAVSEVERLIVQFLEFPIPAVAEMKERIKEDWKLGWYGIVKEGAKSQKVQRPKLTLDEKHL